MFEFVLVVEDSESGGETRWRVKLESSVRLVDDGGQ